MPIINNFVKHQSLPRGKDAILVKHEQILDFAVVPVANGDTVQALRVPENFMVTQAGSKVLVAEGGAAVGTQGDAAAADGWDADVNFNSATPQNSKPADTFPALGGKTYVAEDTIDYFPAADLVAAKVLAWYTGFFLDNPGT